MRGDDRQPDGLLSYVSMEARIPADHSLRAMRELMDAALRELSPLFVLLLLVISASVTGLLILAKPIHLYLSGFKRETFILLFVTGWLVLFHVAVLVGLFVLRA